MAMTMDMIQEQLQETRPQRALRRRQQNEQTPPPKRLRCSVKTPSPRVTPSKRKGVFVDSDVESPVFVARSFYGQSKKSAADSADLQGTPPHLVDSPKHISSSPQALALDNLFKKKMQLATRQGKKSPRVVLTPLRSSTNIGSVSSDKTQSPISRRHNSLPEKKTLVSSPEFPATMPTKKAQETSQKSEASLTSSRKFFKHKSSQSTSKLLGNVVIGRGFKLKFVHRSLSKDYPLQYPYKKKSSRNSLLRNKSGTTIRTTQKAGRKSASVSKLNSHMEKASSSVITSKHDDCFLNCESSALPYSLPTDAVRTSDQNSTTSADENLCSLDDASETPGMTGAVSTSAPHEVQESSKLPGEGHPDQFYPIFTSHRRSQRIAAAKPSQRSNPNSPDQKYGGKQTTPARKRFVGRKGDTSQGVLDAGQKQFGAIQCKDCCMVYSAGDPTDETMHARFHESTLHALKFPRWKKERNVQEFLDDGSRVIMVLPEDPRNIVKKVEEVNIVMAQELGFSDKTSALRAHHKAFLYVLPSNQIVGSVIAEPISEGYRIKPSASFCRTPENQRPCFCSTDPEAAVVGIGRLWVYKPYRKQGIASRLIDCVRQWFEYGIVINKSEVAFSDPTSDGQHFAEKYTGTADFLVYKYVV